MRKTQRAIYGLSSLLASSFLLGCSNSGSSSSASLKTSAFVVTYFDDATTPKKLGTSIVLPHGKAPVPTSFEEGVSYDYLSHSGLDPIQDGSYVGNYFSFTSFVGVYSDETPVDLNNVLSSVEVHPSFEIKKYAYSASYANKDIGLRDDAGNLIKQVLDYGTKPIFPESPVDPSPLWYQNSSFLGFSLENDGKAGVLSSGDDLSFLSGEGAPSGVQTLGSLYFDTSVKSDSYNRDYPAYYSDGSSWVDLGMSLKTGLSLSFDAAYSVSYKKFPVSFYSDKTIDVDKNIIPSGDNLLATSFSITYQDGLSYVINGATTTFTASGVSVSVTTSSTPTSWAGVYTEGATFKNQPVNTSNIQQACFFYPVY